MIDEATGGQLVRYERGGGRRPSDDETLEVATDGAWSARRTVAGTRVGRFAGRLDADALDALRADVDACRTAGGPAGEETPLDGATETITLGDDDAPAIQLGGNATPAGPWGALVTRLRALVDSLVTGPVAAVELVAGTGGASLHALGPEPVAVEPGSIAVTVVRLGSDGALLGRWQAAGPEDAGSADGSPGWQLDLPFGHGLAPQAGDWLQVWVVARVRDGAARTVRLFAGVAC